MPRLTRPLSIQNGAVIEATITLTQHSLYLLRSSLHRWARLPGSARKGEEMSKEEMAERTRKALEEFHRLPPSEQIKRLMASGTINEKGEVQLGSENGEQPKDQSR